MLVCLLASCREPSSAPVGAGVPAVSTPPIATAVARSVQLHELCSTLGAFEQLEQGRWLHGGPKLRATAPSSRGDYAALKFRFLGPSAEKEALGSGERREQIGLKLLARDSCNVTYVMWRLGELPSVVASWKSNPGTRHSECGNRGYHTLRPVWSAPIEVPAVGSTHELSARIDGGFVHVWIDSRAVLRAALEPGMSAGIGEVGLRSDNLRFEVLRFEAVMAETGAAVPEHGRCTSAMLVGD